MMKSSLLYFLILATLHIAHAEPGLFKPFRTKPKLPDENKPTKKTESTETTPTTVNSAETTDPCSLINLGSPVASILGSITDPSYQQSFCKTKDICSTILEGSSLAASLLTITNFPAWQSLCTSSFGTSSTDTNDFCPSTDTACWSCALALATLDYCSSSVIPDFDSADDSTIASCLCYNQVSDNDTSLIWVPNQFDYPFGFCTQYASTADKSDISLFASAAGFCNSIGQVLGANVTSSDLVSTTSLDLSQITGTASTNATAQASPSSETAAATNTKTSGMRRRFILGSKAKLSIVVSAASWFAMTQFF